MGVVGGRRWVLVRVGAHVWPALDCGVDAQGCGAADEDRGDGEDRRQPRQAGDGPGPAMQGAQEGDPQHRAHQGEDGRDDEGDRQDDPEGEAHPGEQRQAEAESHSPGSFTPGAKQFVAARPRNRVMWWFTHASDSR